ncbi:MAG: 2-hydroxyhepta-2,4-diene-1,7-dioate isomerase [Rhodospirillaceae bacterium]|nr:2-hydroxyhepta-2,4-diene-1,7-dioate isomerase [Rhodospirillaceae bacterium]|tara:strand:+ start:937 stop:1809 length:873 start_codon:yes stop_codon:yes gene_type:complete
MKLCRYNDDRLGVVQDEFIYDVTEIQNNVRSRVRYDFKGDPVIAALPEIRGNLEDAVRIYQPISREEINLLSPVARPGKIMAAPVNYQAHVEEMAAQPHITGEVRGVKRPNGISNQGIFLKSNTAMVGESEGVAIRFPDRRNDHEVEFVIIIGKQGSRIKRQDAMEYIAGYTLGLDMTVRGVEDRSFRKSCDGYAPLGPYFVTTDEIPDPNNVPFTVHLNGKLQQDAHTEGLIFDIQRLIEFASEFYTIYPGDVLFTGSPPGVSEIQPGDEMRCNCKFIGEMKIKVRAAE